MITTATNLDGLVTTTITTYAEAIKFLRTAGTKVTANVNHCEHVFLEKGDFLQAMKVRKETRAGPVDYDGEEGYYVVWADQPHILHCAVGF